MNTVQEMLLGMLRNPFFKLFLFSPTLQYLVRKLRVDIVSPFIRGYTGRELLIEVGDKIREQWRLTTFARIRFYRELASNALITEKQLRRLEHGAGIAGDVLAGRLSIEEEQHHLTNSLVITTNPQREYELRLVIMATHRKPIPLPWECDPDFFDKHPIHKRVLLNLRKREHEVAWYNLLFDAMADGLLKRDE